MGLSYISIHRTPGVRVKGLLGHSTSSYKHLQIFASNTSNPDFLLSREWPSRPSKIYILMNVMVMDGYGMLWLLYIYTWVSENRGPLKSPFWGILRLTNPGLSKCCGHTCDKISYGRSTPGTWTLTRLHS